jgi:nitrogen-specific signal transduction histidine kinase
VIFLFVGAFAGSLADAERRQRLRAQETATQLAAANTELQAQAALAERRRASIASILESIDSGVLTLDMSGRISTINRAAQTLLGLSDGIQDDVVAPIRDYLQAGARGYQQVTVDGRMLGLHVSPLIGAQGERLAALGRLAGGLAHEIRNPLGITRAAAQMLHRDIEGQSTLSEYTQVIQSEIDRVDRLIEQLLAYARPVAMARGPVDIAALLDAP